ncbi:hypothetical protein ASPWEDRAFT_43407 [Aspergillus wentii DTO 134E9]|uniref:Mid2 domain-containing protein n=1 Tax=Aspergillus wentii DTO 134E9 TaxID=1073089 RepID=A0A1L9REP9_ASPWE|nr:uncharacterized protein ASPWEDRAFT_43407 [Aspergillus wentii DTO 134E9]KAI9933582.1 hypothetical protein MW887_008055 [Aspergillus wentii]OJJ33333.1 hypothetical protein ASPWEDRAFT_43407 [Aspergillus wentii DTO 134E9]
MATTAAEPTITLSPGWRPTEYGCLRQNDFWIWDYPDPGEKRTVLGGPSQATNCFPSSTWMSTGAYAGTACPSYYTSACQGNDSTAAVTCCPTVYSFECVSANTKLRDSYFPCISRWQSTGNVTLTRTVFASNTITFNPTTLNTNVHLFALGVAYATPTATDTNADSDPTSSSTSTSSLSESNSTNNSSISGGAAAGIGIGSAAGVVLIAALAWLLYRRRKPSKTIPPQTNTGYTGIADASKVGQRYEPPQELPSRTPRRELES